MKPLYTISLIFLFWLGSFQSQAQSTSTNKVTAFADYAGPQMNFLKTIGPIRGSLYQLACRGSSLSYKNAYLRNLETESGKAGPWVPLNLEPFKILDELEDVVMFNEGIWILFSGTNPASKENWLMATEIDPKNGNVIGKVQNLCPMINPRPSKEPELPKCKVSSDGRTLMAYQMGIDYFPVSAGGSEREKLMGMNLGVWKVGDAEGWRKQVVLDDGRNTFERGSAKVDNKGRVLIGGVMKEYRTGTPSSKQREVTAIVALWDGGSRMAKTRAEPNASPNPEFYIDWKGQDTVMIGTVFFEESYRYSMGYATGWWLPTRNQIVWKSQHTWLDGFKDHLGWQASGVGRLGLTFEQLAAPEEATVRGIFSLPSGSRWMMVEVRNPKANRDKVESTFKPANMAGFAESETETWKRIYQFAADAPNGVFIIPLDASLTTGSPYYINRRSYSKLETENCISNLFELNAKPTFLQLGFLENTNRNTASLVQVSLSDGKWISKPIAISGAESYDIFINRSDYMPGIGQLIFGINGAQEWLGLVGF